MKHINSLMIAGLCVHIFIAYFTWLEIQHIGVVWGFTPFILLNIIGLILIIADRPKLGSNLFLVGCLAFVPIGIVGIFGARKLLDGIKDSESMFTL